MPYVYVQDFKGGLDRRRIRAAQQAGTLWSCQNAHITRGAEIEKAKVFLERYILPPGLTHGLGYITPGPLTVFGSGTRPVTLHADIGYQQLGHPDGAGIVGILDIEEYEDKFYVVADHGAHGIAHYYDGAFVWDWSIGKVRPAHASLAQLAAELNYFIDQDPVLSSTLIGTTITIVGPVNTPFTVVGTATNGPGNPANDQLITVTNTQAATAVLPQITTAALSGTLEAGDEYTITVTIGGVNKNFGRLGKPSPVARNVLAYKSKMYGVATNILSASGVNTATGWDTSNPGAGFVVLSKQSSGVGEAFALAEYFRQIAVLGKTTIQLWEMDADFASNNYVKPLKNTGTIASLSVIAFGENDVIYLSGGGIRSIRARDSSNEAFVSDVGTAIDDLVKDTLLPMSIAARRKAVAMIDPIDGRYMLAIGDTVFVLSMFPTSKISAWSLYKPGFTVDWWEAAEHVTYARSGDRLYALGGANGDQYDANTEVLVELPFVDAQDPATPKEWFALDAVLEGAWDIYLGFDEARPDAYELVATVDSHTFAMQRIPVNGNSPKVFARLVHKGSAARARLGHLVLHYRKMPEEGSR